MDRCCSCLLYTDLLLCTYSFNYDICFWGWIGCHDLANLILPVISNVSKKMAWAELYLNGVYYMATCAYCSLPDDIKTLTVLKFSEELQWHVLSWSAFMNSHFGDIINNFAMNFFLFCDVAFSIFGFVSK